MFLCSCDSPKIPSKAEQVVVSLEPSFDDELSVTEGRMLCSEQEKCFNKSFDIAEDRYGTGIANPSFDLFNDYRMSIYAECESGLFRKHSIAQKEGYEIYRESGCEVIPMSEKYYRGYY